MAHSLISPSSFNRASLCPVSNILPRVKSSAEALAFADEGTKAHEYLESVLKSEEDIRDIKASHICNLVPESFQRGVLDAILYIQRFMDRNHTYEVSIEETYKLDFLIPEMKGTADVIIFNKDSNTLHVCDFKYGAGIEVSAEKNTQLLLYAIGYINTYNINAESIYLHIMQPRIGNFSYYKATISDIQDVFSTVREIISNLINNSREAYVGEHCRFCPCYLSCPAIRQKTKSIIDSVSKKEFDDMDSVEKIIGHKSIIEKFFIQGRQYLQDKLQQGEELSFLKATPKNLPNALSRS